MKPQRHAMTNPGQWLRIFWAAFCLVLVSPGVALGAASAQDAAFDRAARLFQDSNWERASGGFAEFIDKYPKASRRAEAVLYEAQSFYKLQKFDTARDLLTANLPQAGKWEDAYLFWLAEATFAKGDYHSAAGAYARFLTQFPNSTNLLAAAYGEALARYRQNELPAVINLLSQSNSVFRAAAALNPKHETVARGYLLLAETLLESRQYRTAETTLENVAANLASADLNWRREYLMCRVLRGSDRLEAALGSATNLVQLALLTQQPDLIARSVNLKAETLEQLRRPSEASAAYEFNLTNAPASYRREALLKIIDLNLGQNDITNTIQKLELFTARNPKDPALDVAHLTLGELRLRQFYEAVGGSATNDEVTSFGAATNLVNQAITNLNVVLADFEKGPRAGKAYLDRGWALWHLGRRPESLVDFFQATQRLPVSEDQAIARYKLAEVQFLQRDYSNAVVNFQLVINNYANLPAVKSTLFDQALYKIVRGGVATGNMDAAGEAARKILAWYPESYFSDRSLLVYGQALNYQGSSAEARAQFAAFLERFPDAPLASELRLAVARTYIQEDNWKAAARQYDGWIKLYPTNGNLAQAEYDRAWVTWKSGDDTNALALMTNLVARFPNHPNAPLAQRSIADFFFNQEQYPKAELNYKLLFQNTNAPVELAMQAGLSAGRAACARLGFADARGQLLEVINHPLCPPELLAEALYRLGDTWIEDGVSDPNKPESKFGEANVAFLRVTQNYPTNRLAALAWGKMGGAHLQLALQETNRYELAAQAYTNSLTHPEADFYVRGLAEIGLGAVFEKQGKVAAALEHYENVVYFDEAKMRPGEQPNPQVIKEAGLKAARLLEDQKDWEKAIKLYERLERMLPNLRGELEAMIDRVRKRNKSANS